MSPKRYYLAPNQITQYRNQKTTVHISAALEVPTFIKRMLCYITLRYVMLCYFAP